MDGSSREIRANSGTNLEKTEFILDFLYICLKYEGYWSLVGVVGLLTADFPYFQRQNLKGDEAETKGPGGVKRPYSAPPLPDVVPDGEPQHAHYGLPALNGGPVPHGAANPAPGLQQANRNHGLLGGAVANLFVIIGFAAFAYTVKYMLRSIAQE